MSLSLANRHISSRQSSCTVMWMNHIQTYPGQYFTWSLNSSWSSSVSSWSSQHTTCTATSHSGQHGRGHRTPPRDTCTNFEGPRSLQALLQRLQLQKDHHLPKKLLPHVNAFTLNNVYAILIVIGNLSVIPSYVMLPLQGTNCSTLWEDAHTPKAEMSFTLFTK